MIELHRIRTDKEAVINGLHQRGVSNAEELIQAICNLDIEKRAIQFQLDNLSATLNKLNQEIADLLRKNDGAAPLEAKKKKATN